MGDSEKLGELISEIQYMGGLESRLAEHLIANGVTIRKWIPVAERLPELDDIVLTWDGCDIGKHIWDNKKRKFVRLDSIGNAFLEVRFVTHWMPLPKPPKEE